MAVTPTDVRDAGQSSAAGIACVCAGSFCLTVNDAIAKWLGTFYPVVEVVFFRMLAALPLIVVLGVFLAGARNTLVTRRPLVHLGRGALATGAALTFFLGLTLLPLAVNTAIAFAAPLFVTVLARPVLGERPGRGQWVVTLLGFGGVLLVIRPGLSAFSLAGLVPLTTALCYALLMMSARRIGRRDGIWVTMVYATAVPLVCSGVMLPWYWVTPAPAHVPGFIALGIAGGAAMTLITQGFRIGVASVVAPFDYTGLVWATAFGALLWGEWPGPLAMSGAGLIVACGILLAIGPRLRWRWHQE